MIISEKKLRNARMEIRSRSRRTVWRPSTGRFLRRYEQNAKIDGYRKGKVPLELVERKFSDMADQEVAENLLRSVLSGRGYGKRTTGPSRPPLRL